jgi:hypothetical protein
MPNRRIISILTAAVAACVLLTAATSSTAAPAATTPPVALTGSIAGNVQITQPGDTDTFVFTETNKASVGVNWFIQPFGMTGVSIQDVLCVFPLHRAGGGDGDTCEPFLLPGQTTSLVLTTHVTGASGSTASVKVCAYNGGGPGGNGQPCKTLSVKING